MNVICRDEEHDWDAPSYHPALDLLLKGDSQFDLKERIGSREESTSQ